MRRRRSRGGANCGRALKAKNALNPERAGLANEALENIGPLLTQEETKEEPYLNWRFRKRQDPDEVKRLKRPRTRKSSSEVKPDTAPHIGLLPSKVKSHPKNSRFSNIENLTLISKLVQVYDQLLGKYKNRTSYLKKRQMWQEICDAVNSAGNKQRFVGNCKKRFNDIKNQLKNKLNQEKSLLGDQAGPSGLKVCYTQYEEELKKVLPAEVIDGIEFFDSDHPQELCSRKEAGLSWCTPQNDQSLGTSQELPNITEPGEVQRSLYTDLLNEQWPMLPDLSSTFSIEASSVRSRNFFTDHIDLQPECSDPKKVKLHPSQCPVEHPSPHNVPKLTPNHDTQVLNGLQASQKLFKKSMMHSLDILHSDVRHFSKCINESNSIADDLLRVESESNGILHQMNIQLGKLTGSVEQLAKQQKAQHVLLHDFPKRQNSSQALYTSI